MMFAAVIPGNFLSPSWWLWASSGVLCCVIFTLLWIYYRQKAQRMPISRTMAILWATVVTVPGLFFAAGALWWALEMIRVAMMS